MDGTRQPLANWNGDEMPLSEVRVSVLDRAFLFGDAVYEVLRIYRGVPFLCQNHMTRLARSLEKVGIPCDVGRLERRMDATLEHSGVREGTIYIQVTRGEGPRTHHFPQQPRPNELIYVQELTEDPYAAQRERGAAVITVDDLRWRRCDIKSINLLANCLAAEAAHAAGCVEALLVSPDGSVTEGSHTSLFGVKHGQLLTTPLGDNILPGITRGLLFQLADRAEVRIREHSLTRDELHAVDELFLTGTTSEVLPITQVDGAAVGHGRPGPIARRLHAEYGRFVEEEIQKCAGGN